MDSRWTRFERLRKSNGSGGKHRAGFFCCILRLIHRNNQCFSYQRRQTHSPPNSDRHSKWMVLGYKGLSAVCGLRLIEKEDWSVAVHRNFMRAIHRKLSQLMLWRPGRVPVHLLVTLIRVITLQMVHSLSSFRAGEDSDNCHGSMELCQRRGDTLEKKKNNKTKSKALAGRAIILVRLLESDKGAGGGGRHCRRGCLAPGLLDLPDIPPTGTV